MTEKICILCNQEKAVKRHSYCLKCVRQKHKNYYKERYKKTPYKGFIYVISNPAWAGWVKIGRAIDVSKRLKNYNVSSPLRDYEVNYCTMIDNPVLIERHFFKMYGSENNEWFKISVDEAVHQIKKLKFEYETENRR
jgi:hypothetical protein